MSLWQKTAYDLLTGLRDGIYSSLDVTQSFVDQVQTLDPHCKSFLRFDPDYALNQARELDQTSTNDRQPLFGLPVAIKDVICVKDQTTTCASRILEKFVSPYDATVIERLKKSQALIFGKTNMDEFAMGSSNENSAFQNTHNPWNLETVPGGSSGGAAACVAARMVPVSLGSDTGGSVRQPAALCGVTGLKPTYGRISRYGLIAFASSLDQIGILGHDARDVAMLLNHCAGFDEKDSTSSPTELEDFAAQIEQSIAGQKIGVPREYFESGLDDEIRQSFDSARQVLADLGAEFVEISLPMTTYGVATYYLVASCEASGNLARYDGAHYGFRAELPTTESCENELLQMYRQTRSEGFGAEVKRRIMLGTYALSSGYYDAYYLKALKTRRLIQDEFKQAFEEVDLILGPTTPTTAFRIGEKAADPLAMYLGDIYTVVANLAGIPAISFPAGFSKAQMPIGLQLQGPAFSESRLLNTTYLFQSQTDWHQRDPKLVSEGASA